MQTTAGAGYDPTPERAGASATYRMINSLRINDFKCFPKAEVEQIRRFNVMVGQSGSGKTALLEAIFLVAGGSQELYFRTRRWRGFNDEIEATSSAELFETIGRDLINLCGDADASYIRFNDPDSGPRTLKISRRASQRKLLIDPKDMSVSVASPIHFKWTLGNKKEFESTLEFVKDAIRVKGNQAPVYQATFLTPASMSHRETVRRFSALSRRSEHRPLVTAIQEVYPAVSDISVEMELGRVALYATIQGLPEKLPLPAISSGLQKYIAIAAAIVSQPRGVVLIDEIENGFYYKDLVPLMRSVYTLACQHEVQIFASTHSYEFLEAMAEVMSMEKDANDFSLIRLARVGASTTVNAIAGQHGIDAIKQSFEVR
jgi:ABC-type lipoprotein export system ATPase subunit